MTLLPSCLLTATLQQLSFCYDRYKQMKVIFYISEMENYRSNYWSVAYTASQAKKIPNKGKHVLFRFVN